MAQQACVLNKRVSKTVHLPYLLSLPTGYSDDPARTWPLILFLHGAGERAGNDMILLRKYGIARLAETWDRPFITVSPQCRPDRSWSTEIDPLIALLNDITKHYAVNRSRVYLTGMSMGGFGSWLLGALAPQRFAAVVPICGGWPWTQRTRSMVAALKDTPVWAFHGAKDNRVSLEESQVLVDELKKAGGNVRLTIYPEAGHDSWTETYNNPELYEWLLAQHK
jgi:predicted peptidase